MNCCDNFASHVSGWFTRPWRTNENCTKNGQKGEWIGRGRGQTFFVALKFWPQNRKRKWVRRTAMATCEMCLPPTKENRQTKRETDRQTHMQNKRVQVALGKTGKRESGKTGRGKRESQRITVELLAIITRQAGSQATPMCARVRVCVLACVGLSRSNLWLA